MFNIHFHLVLVPKGTQPSDLSLLNAKRDATQWSFLLLCQRGCNPVVFPFTLPKGTQPSGLSFYFDKGDVAQWYFLLFSQRRRNLVVFHFYFPCTCFHMLLRFIFISSNPINHSQILSHAFHTLSSTHASHNFSQFICSQT
jgi:hypothetical protein